MVRISFLVLCLGICFFGFSQTVPLTTNLFFGNIKPNNQLPERILNGRSMLIFTPEITTKDLIQIQQQFAQTGIDAVSVMPFHFLVGGPDVGETTLQTLKKREIHNLCFVRKKDGTYTLTLAAFSGNKKWIDATKVWQLSGSSLYELLLQLNREALNSYSKKNLLISESPDIQSELNIINGSRVEAFTADLKVDRVAVRLSGRNEEDALLKEVCAMYPYKLEFVGDSLTDAQLRQKGFWYVLNAVSGSESMIKTLLGYVDKNPVEAKTQDVATRYKFYLKKLEFDIFYLGKSWDASEYWPQALENYLRNIRKEFNIP